MAPLRVDNIAKKRTALVNQISSLDNALTKNKIDKQNAKFRVTRLTQLFNAYEELYGELTTTDTTIESSTQFAEIQDSFYELMCRIENMPSASTSSIENSQIRNNDSMFFEKQNLLKLPIAELPKFDGDHNKWLSYKNTFLSMIDSRTDIDDVIKFLYLKNSLRGRALSKLTIFDASAANYKVAWKLLQDTYEKKRILVTKHIDAIMDISPLNVATSQGLSNIIDEVRQHLSMLKSLEVIPDHHFVLRVLVKALPSDIRQKWEESLNLDTLPDLDQFYTFINETSFRLCAMEQNTARATTTLGKRRGERETHTTKTRKNESGARTFVISQTNRCTHCRGDHAIYKCPSFEKLTIQQKWNVIKSKKLCRNCLRAHTGICNYARCKQCDRFHNELLHFNSNFTKTRNSTESRESVHKKEDLNRKSES